MRRRLFTILSALSLLLCVAVVVLWVRSYVAADHFGRWTRYFEGANHPFFVEKSSGIFSTRGRLYIVAGKERVLASEYGTDRIRVWGPDTVAPPPPPPQDIHGWIRDQDSLWPLKMIADEENFVGIEKLGFGTGRCFRGRLVLTIEVDFVTLPFWFAAIATLVFPSLWTRLALRRRRASRLREKQRCPSCGYDLRATPERCPECGREARSIRTEVNA